MFVPYGRPFWKTMNVLALELTTSPNVCLIEAVAGLQQWKLDGLAEKLASGLYVFEVVADEGTCSIKAVR